MLHELLLALYGISGGIFIESTEKGGDNDDTELDRHLIPLVNDNLLLPESELSLQRELLKLGSCYNYLIKFIEKFSEPNYGLYLSAFAFGIDDSLKEYRADLCTLETELSTDKSMGVSHLSCRLHAYKILLPVLVKVTKKVESVVINPEMMKHTSSSSCRLLDVILSATPPGLPGPRYVMRKVVSRVMQVFYRQLSSWLIYGVLYDPYSEFFIKKLESNHISDEKKKQQPLFVIDSHCIPSFLPTTFAQRVFETGQAVYSASHNPSEASFILELEKVYIPRFTEISTCVGEDVNGIQSTESSLSNLINVNEIDSLVCDIKSVVLHHVWCSVIQQHKFIDYLRLFKDVLLLGRGELFLAFLDQLNFKNQTPPTNENEVEALEYDITQAFLAAAARCLGLDDEELDDQFRIFIKLKTTSQQDPAATTTTTANPTTDLTVLDCLYLQINIPSALDCLFSTQICHAYNRLFHFLFSIRRTQLKLQQYWADQILLWRRARSSAYYKTKKGPGRNADDDNNITMSNSNFVHLQLRIGRRLLVRNHMAFIIENLLYYLQVDVIESQFSHLLYRCQTDQDIQLIQIAHEAYLASLQAQALLFMPNVKQCIFNLLNTCRQFVHISSQIAYDSSSDTGGVSLENIQLSNKEEHIISAFYNQSKLLYELISMSCSTGAKSSVSINSAYTHRFSRGNNNNIINNNSNNNPVLNSGTADLNQLLLRLDFNNYYSNLPEDLI
ncbi:unnamed protein product [Trichobilharzia szidati]|nr:unnamed protein product [Trichobilharzia szidati]